MIIMFNPNGYKPPIKRKYSPAYMAIQEHGYYIREHGASKIVNGRKEVAPDHVYQLCPECKGYDPVETVVTRSIGSIESNPGESLKDFVERLGWI